MRKKIDLRKFAILSITPDLLDKPIGLLFSDRFGNNTRLFAHSLLFSLVLLFIFLRYRKGSSRAQMFALWLAYLGHMLLDRVWYNNLPIFFWPFLGQPSILEPNILVRWYNIIYDSYSMGGEAIGFCILLAIFLQYGLYRRSRMRQFLRNGVLG